MLDEIAQLVARHCGLGSLPKKRWRFESKAFERMKKLCIPNPEEYFALLNHPVEGPSELKVLIETIRVGETGWLRHKKQFRDLSDLLLPHSEIKRLWSAGCAEGQEAYSLALSLLSLNTRLDFTVLGTDISEAAVKIAASGEWPIKDSDTKLGFEQKQFFAFDDNGNIQAKDILKRHCSFRVHNLMSAQYPKGFNLIMCRNVLIYMSLEARRYVIEKLIQSLVPNGYLVLGYSEMNDFESDLIKPERHGDSIFWRRVSESNSRKAENGNVLGKIVSQAGHPGFKTKLNINNKTTTNVLKLEGSFTQDKIPQLNIELRQLLARSPQEAIVEIDGVDFLCKEAALQIRRAAAQQRANGGEFVLIASKPGTRHWALRSSLSQWMQIKEIKH